MFLRPFLIPKGHYTERTEKRDEEKNSSSTQVGGRREKELSTTQ